MLFLYKQCVCFRGTQIIKAIFICSFRVPFFLSQIFAPHLISDSLDHSRTGMMHLIMQMSAFEDLYFFLMGSYILVTQGASSRVCGIFPLLWEVESCREPLPLHHTSAPHSGSRSVSHPVLPSLEDLRNTGSDTKLEKQSKFRTVPAQASIPGGPFPSVMVMF